MISNFYKKRQLIRGISLPSICKTFLENSQMLNQNLMRTINSMKKNSSDMHMKERDLKPLVITNFEENLSKPNFMVFFHYHFVLRSIYLRENL